MSNTCDSHSQQQQSNKLKGGKWAVVPTLLPRTAMRLSEAAFWDFPLTPHKVRMEQEQKAEHKHFKRHSRKTERAPALWGKCDKQPLSQTVTKRDRRGPRQGDKIITFTADQ